MIAGAGASLAIWLAGSFVAAAAATYAVIIALMPLLRRIALARPNARSSHKEPTPQGGGAAVIAVTSGVVAAVAAFAPYVIGDHAWRLVLVGAAVLLLAVVSAVDDVRGLPALPRFAAHVVGTAIMLAALPPDLRLIPALPLAAERAVLLVAVVWFINLVNFMDGLDWITLVEVLPICAGVAIAGALGGAPPVVILIAIALGGAMIGFAPFNKPVAALFLGDVGSVPIGLILSWLLLQLAGAGHGFAALLLPLYYLADASITLSRRLLRGEAVWQAHRTHFYQIATDRGFSVNAVVAQVATLNVALMLLALVTVVAHSQTFDWVALALGALLVLGQLRRFAQGPASSGVTLP